MSMEMFVRWIIVSISIFVAKDRQHNGQTDKHTNG